MLIVLPWQVALGQLVGFIQLLTCNDTLGGRETLAEIPVNQLVNGARAAAHSWRLSTGVMDGRRAPLVRLGELVHHPHG